MNMKIERVTPILVVKDIESTLPFWEKMLGYKRLATVPDEGPFVFAMLANGDSQLMLQTRASIEEDLKIPSKEIPTTILYVDVESVDAALAATKGAKVFMKPRETFYGKHEVGVIDPTGNYVVFAANPPSKKKK
jgi:uncharacterized glyoxalase superfamily protein PhnB